ncbi:MAG: 4Fe-4S binding protein [Anaerolineae bacterium]|nr:4Fe-4S binding protein [Anaerolineae bacterium]
MTDLTPYRPLAQRLDALPNGFPPTGDGAELRLLAHLFSPEEAALAAQLRITKETPAQVTERTGGDPKTVRQQLKDMVRRGLITAGRVEGGLGYGLMPFVVGIYEMQSETIDAELARLFEDYYTQAFGPAMSVTEPAFHRVIPVNQSVPVDMEIHPYESAADIVNRMQAWGVTDCICRKQKALIGDPCEHPIEMCMVFSGTAGAFDQADSVRALTRDGALALLREAAEIGLVHTINNTQNDVWYVCNCCTCSCGILRGVAELGRANVVARSAFVNRVDADLCIACEDCLPYCQFDALTLDDGVMQVDRDRCVGCGVCVVHCSVDAMAMVRRPADEIKPIPASDDEWRTQRAAARGKPLVDVL